MTIQSRIDNPIRQLREKRGLTQVKLASMTGLSQAHISTLENNTRNPSMATMKLIAKALGVKPSRILDTRDLEGTNP